MKSLSISLSLFNFFVYGCPQGNRLGKISRSNLQDEVPSVYGCPQGNRLGKISSSNLQWTFIEWWSAEPQKILFPPLAEDSRKDKQRTTHHRPTAESQLWRGGCCSSGFVAGDSPVHRSEGGPRQCRSGPSGTILQHKVHTPFPFICPLLHMINLPVPLTKTKLKAEWEAQAGMCQWSKSVFCYVDVLPWTCLSEGKWPSRQSGRQSNHYKWHASQRILCVEELETLRVGTKPRTAHHWMPEGERHGKRKHSMIFLERMREGHRQSDEHWDCFKGNVGKTAERQGGAHTFMGFFEHIGII